MLIPFHAITGCDNISGFHRRGKKSVFEKFQKDQEAQQLLQRVGECLELPDNMRDHVRRFLLLKHKLRAQKQELQNEEKRRRKALSVFLLIKTLCIIIWIKLTILQTS